MISRRAAAVVVSAGAVLAAYVALASGLDRMSRDDPRLATRVPGDFRSVAWRQEATTALEANALPAARSAAAASIVADPVDPASAAALGLIRLTANDATGAEAAFRVAGELGWRDLPTQLYWLSAAGAAGDYRVATERADALLRQNVALLEQPQLLAGIERTPDGRRALAARLASRPPWFGEYWNRTFTLAPAQLAVRASVLDEPALRPAALRCEEVRGLATRLGEAGQAARGRSILSRFCGAGGGGLLQDGGFERSRLDAAAPFGWQFAGVGGLDIRLGKGEPGRGTALTVASTLPYRIVFVTQALQLAPGRYRLAWRAHDAGGTASNRIAVRLACLPDAGAFLASTLQRGDRRAAIAEVSADCPNQRFELAITPGAGVIAIDDVAIAPADRAGR